MVDVPPPTGISLIIPTMNRPDVLLDTLHDIKTQNFHDYEVIVLDQSDEPNAEAKALLATFRVHTRYKYVTHFRGLPKARNCGWRLSSKDLVVYIDDDIRCGPDFLQSHYDAHLQTGAAMVAGGITEAKGDQPLNGSPGSFNKWTATPARNYHSPNPGWCSHAPGGNFSINQSALEALCGFDEQLTVGAALYEETEFGLRLSRAGYRCWFEPKAHLTHLAAPMGGCRVGPDTGKYVYGMAHNRAIVIFRHLQFWHKPTAIARMILFGLSYSKADRSLAPFFAGIRGLFAGRRAAGDIIAFTSSELCIEDARNEQ